MSVESPVPCNAGGFAQLHVIAAVLLGNRLQAPCKNSWAGAKGDAGGGCRELTHDWKELLPPWICESPPRSSQPPLVHPEKYLTHPTCASA